MNGCFHRGAKEQCHIQAGIHNSVTTSKQNLHCRKLNGVIVCVRCFVILNFVQSKISLSLFCSPHRSMHGKRRYFSLLPHKFASKKKASTANSFHLHFYPFSPCLIYISYNKIHGNFLPQLISNIFKSYTHTQTESERMEKANRNHSQHLNIRKNLFAFTYICKSSAVLLLFFCFNWKILDGTLCVCSCVFVVAPSSAPPLCRIRFQYRNSNKYSELYMRLQKNKVKGRNSRQHNKGEKNLKLYYILCANE